jgi:hypothetical protein
MGKGWTKKDGALTMEDVRDHFDEIDDPSDYTILDTATDELRILRDALQ